MTQSAPLVSVIMPVHNGAEWLPAALEGVLAQTMGDFELIAVDDGSTDAVPQVLGAYAARDPRMRVITHVTPQGAGAARNAGLDAARGTYLLFLDADDLFEPELLERVVTAAQAARADVALFGADEFDPAGVTRENRFIFAHELLPACDPFNRDDVPARLFQLCTPEAWTKLIRREFAQERGLRFQDLPNTNDMLFTLSALALAERVTSVCGTFVHHRVGRAGSIQTSRKRTSLAFLDALRALQSRLRREGLLDQLQESFANLAVFHCLYNAEAPASWPCVFAEFGVGLLPADAYWQPGDFARVAGLVCEAWDDSASPADAFPPQFWRQATFAVHDALVASERAHRADVEQAWAEAELVKSSASFRLGRALTAPMRLFRRGRT